MCDSLRPHEHQAFLSFTISKSLLKLMSTHESVMPSNHLILCCPLLLLPSVFPSIRVFSNAAAAKSHQLCPTLCDPIDNSLPGSRPWDSPGTNTGVGCHFLLQCMKVKSESEVAQSCLTLRNPMNCSPPGSSIHGISQARVLEWGAITKTLVIAETLGNHCCCCSVPKLCPTLCDSMDYSMPGFPILYYLPEFAQTHVH